ncbi:MAG: AbrB/MazE/SpoVT family DNA-binding domain-containing protein [Candidatus Micrarchaeota archaeon]
MHSVVLSEKGQLVIPKHLRAKYKLEKGSKLVLLEENGRLVLEKSDSVVEKLKQFTAAQQSASLASQQGDGMTLQNNSTPPVVKRDAREIT